MCELMIRNREGFGRTCIEQLLATFGPDRKQTVFTKDPVDVNGMLYRTYPILRQHNDFCIPGSVIPDKIFHDPVDLSEMWFNKW
jgi:hypothetical protein